MAVVKSRDGAPLSVEQDKSWFDNFIPTLKKQTGKEPESNDQE